MTTVTIADDGRTVLLRLETEEDGNLLETVEGLLAEGRRQFVLDLGGHDFLNSVKIATVIQCHHLVEAAGGLLRVAGLEPRMRQIFQVLKLERLFALDDTIADALAAFGP